MNRLGKGFKPVFLLFFFNFVPKRKKSVATRHTFLTQFTQTLSIAVREAVAVWTNFIYFFFIYYDFGKNSTFRGLRTLLDAVFSMLLCPVRSCV